MPANLILLAMAVGLALDSWRVTFEGKRAGLTLIDELRADKLTAGDVQKVEVFQFGRPGPFETRPVRREDQLARFQRKALATGGAIQEMMAILRKHTRDDDPWRNHPGYVYEGLVRVETRDGGYYYLFFNVYYDYDLKTEYANLRVGAKYNLNWNGTKPYENTEFAAFLKRRDPWFPKRD